LLDQLADATADLKRLEASNVLSVSGAPSVVSRWLVPRLGRLTERHPDLEARILTSAQLTDFAYPGLPSALLMREEIFSGLPPRAARPRTAAS
jgi:LysR family glycine cleavage system transcriptional activator